MEQINRNKLEENESIADLPNGINQDAHEKGIMMQAFDKVRQMFEGRQWIMEGRGGYPYNDDRYKEEVRYMYDEFDTLQKDTWKNIESKSIDYRKAIIAEYIKGTAAGREEDAVEFAEWAGWDWRRVEGKSMWENQKTLEVLSTSKLYERYKKETGG